MQGRFYRINGEFKLEVTSLCKLRKYYEVKFDERQNSTDQRKALAEIDKADGLEKLNDVRAAILGKKGELTAVLKGMKDVAPDERPKVGQWVNETREAVEKLLDEKVKKFEAEALKRKYESEKIDVTMPAKRSKRVIFIL